MVARIGETMLRLYLAMERDLLVVSQTRDAKWDSTSHLVGMQPTCIAIDPLRPERIYCGTFGRGLWRSNDAGVNWKPIGNPGLAMEPYDEKGIPWAKVMSLAVSGNEHNRGYGFVYAGTEPAAGGIISSMPKMTSEVSVKSLASRRAGTVVENLSAIKARLSPTCTR